MNLDALKKQYPLHPQVLEIYKAVKAISDKDVDFRELPKLDVAARTKIARQRMPKHVIFYNYEQIGRINYILAHEFGHIIRMFSLPPAERLVQANEDQHIRLAAETLSHEMKALPVTLRPKMLTMWVSGLISQLVNLPIDTRIEQWLAANHPAFASEQIKGLKVDVDAAVRVLSPDVERLIAPTIFRFSSAMGYAYLRAIAPILNENPLAPYEKRSEIVALGEQLYHWLEDQTLSDLAIVNRWAETLGISEWFYWRDFEDMPESYYQDVI